MAYNYQRENFMSEYKRRCPVCRKTFWASSEWVYKKGYAKNLRIYCSWHCMREEEKSKQTVGDKIGQAIEDGLTNAEIRELLGVTQKQIDYWRERKL